MTTGTRRQGIFGPEAWAEFTDQSWCHFDRWFALVAVADFGGDLDALRSALEERLRSLQGRRDVEAKLSHLADLRMRMAEAGVAADTLAAHDPADKSTYAKARRKVLVQAVEGRAMTESMHRTPRAQLVERAKCGHWPSFPISPQRWYDQLTGNRPVGFATKGQSFAITRRYGDRLARLDNSRRTVAERLALHRAFHTVGLELADSVDDSYGVVGELRLEAFRTYLSIDWADAGMSAEAYWRDLCELLVAESYALTHQAERLPFERVPPEAGEMVAGILLGLAIEWRAAYQDYHGDEAEALVAWLHLAACRQDRYVDTARRLGSKLWQPIVASAESALAGRDRQLAVEVFRAADQPGWHRDFLRTRCFELTGVRLEDITHHTGAPRDILTTRLRKLEEHGLVERVQYQERPPRFEYHLTPLGRTLMPVLTVLRD